MDEPATVHEHSAGVALVRGRGDERQVLLLRVRARGLELPKGHVEPGESAEAAALRELGEETGLVGPAPALGVPLAELRYGFVDAGGRRVEKSVRYFLAAHASDAAPTWGPRPRRTRELRWVGVDELDALELVSEDLRVVVRAALAAAWPG